MTTNSTDKRINRRDFVRGTGAAVASGGLVSCALGPDGAKSSESSAIVAAAAPAILAAPAGQTRKDTLRVGLIGCGGRGTGAAGQALSADPDVVLWALGDVFQDQLDSSLKNLTDHAKERVQVPAERQFVGFDAFQNVIDSGVDVVILTTPPHFRPQHLRAAVEAKKHIFCEKPMAVDPGGVRSVIESAQKAKAQGTNLMSGFCWRYSYPERATYQKIHEGAIGDIQAMHTTYHTGILRQAPREPKWSEMEFQLRNWLHFLWLSGDHITEQACHSIDKINWAMRDKPPLRATALGGRQCREGEASGNIYDHFTVIYEYENDVRAFHTCRQMKGLPSDNSDYIFGTKGKCTVNGWTPTHVITGENAWKYDGERPNMYQVEHNELFAAIRKGDLINDGDYMATSTMMSIIGRMAAYTGQTIAWEDAMKSDLALGPGRYEFGEVAVTPVPRPGVTV